MSFWARIGLVISNLVPLIGVVMWGWDPTTLFVLYWVELVIVVVLSVPKSLIARRGTQDKQPDIAVLLVLPLIFFVIPILGTYAYLILLFEAKPIIASLFVKGPVQYAALGFLVSHLLYALIDLIVKSQWDKRAPIYEFAFAAKYMFTVVFPIWSLGQFMDVHIKDPIVILIAYVAFKIWVEAILYRYEGKVPRH